MARRRRTIYNRENRRSSSSTDSESIPSGEIEFNELLRREDRKLANHSKGKDQMDKLFEKERQHLSNSDCSDEESADKWKMPRNESTSRRKSSKKKRHFKRGLSTSSSSSSMSNEIETKKISKPAKSWGRMWKELRDGGNKLYARILKNFEKGYYHIALNNEHEFVVMIVGMILNLEFLDKEGRFYSQSAKALQTVLGDLRGKPSARVLLAPKPCQEDGLSNAAFFRCITKNVRRAPAILPPKHSMRRVEAVKAVATLPNYQAIPQLVDQMLFRDGMCVRVQPSLISTALARPNAPRGEHPFLINLLVTMNDMDQPNTPFSDPCHKSIQCIPTRVISLTDKRFIKQATTTSGVDHKTTKSNNISLEQIATTRFWNRRRVHPRSKLLIKFKFRLSYASNFSTLSYGPEKPGWALIFLAGKVPRLTHRIAYGYLGMKGSIALVFDLVTKSLAIHRDGISTPLMSKKSSTAPPELAHDNWHQVLVQYRPREKLLAVSISTINDPQHQFVSVFPVDIPEGLQEVDRMRIGMSMAAAGYAVISIKEFKVQPVLPDLGRTRIYYLDNYSVIPHETGRFLLELRDQCGEIVSISPMHIRVKLVLEKSKSVDLRSDSIAAIPEYRSVVGKIRSYPKYGVYLVKYRPSVAGRYNVMVSFREGLTNNKSKPIPKWHRVEYYQIYVRNIW